MQTSTFRAFAVRMLLPVLLLITGWQVGTPLPAARALDAPVTEFSAARADAVLARLLGAQQPHPASSPENAAVRDRVIAEFAALGLTARVERGHGCHAWGKLDVFACGSTENIIAPVFAGDGPAVLLMAHYDSVPAGPGAADDMSGVAAVLETIRALQARGGPQKHPLMALITDGEEAGLLGAAAFTADAAAMKNIGAVVNVEARGNQGQSSLFQTSAGDEPLIDLYAEAAQTPMSSSLATLVYKLMPNDTDLTMFGDSSVIAFNFAFMKNVAHYHTPLDRRENLNPQSLQHQGDNLLGVAQQLLTREFTELKSDKNAIYLPILGALLPRLPMSWALPLALMSLLLMVTTMLLSRRRETPVKPVLLALIAPLLMLVGSAVLGWLLHLLASRVSGHADPSFAHPAPFRAALCVGIFTVALLCSRLAEPRLLALSVWTWLSLLAVVTGSQLPGFSPYFLFPAMVAAPVMLISCRRADAWTGPLGTVALFIAALPAVLIWTSLARTIEPIQGLLLHPAFTIPISMGALGLLPMLAALKWGKRHLPLTILGSTGVALGLAVFTGTQPAFSTQAPQKVNITFVDDHTAGTSHWAVEATGALPPAIRAVADFTATPERPWPAAWSKAYLAKAGPNVFAAPTAQVSSEPEGQGRKVTVTLQGTGEAERLWLVVPSGSGLTRVGFQGQTYVPRTSAVELAGTVVGCMTRDCTGQQVELHFDSARPVTAWLGEQQFHAPKQAAALMKARPAEATPQHTGDTTVIVGNMMLP